MDASRRVIHRPCHIAAEANTRQSQHGSAPSHSDAADDKVNTISAPAASREARHSMRQLDDSLDKTMQLRVIGHGLTHAPLPELIVLTTEQA